MCYYQFVDLSKIVLLPRFKDKNTSSKYFGFAFLVLVLTISINGRVEAVVRTNLLDYLATFFVFICASNYVYYSLSKGKGYKGSFSNTLACYVFGGVVPYLEFISALMFSWPLLFIFG